MIGETDGAYFELKERYLCKIDPNEAREQIQTGESSASAGSQNEDSSILVEETPVDTAGQDNRDLCDEGDANQSLQHGDIQQMKSEGASGRDIISQLVSNSATFEKKTAFSQQKYLKKKKKK